MKRILSFFALVALLSLGGASAFAQTSVRFAAVGDFNVSADSQSVANLVASWNPDFVITVGDNNYTKVGTTEGWDDAVGQFYNPYIKYPAGSTSVYAAGHGSPDPPTNNFYPALGNHDWDAGGFTTYFDLPGNGRYFDYVRGPVHFFVVDSDQREGDGVTSGSVQGKWLQNTLAASTSQWKIVYFHHPPYSSSASHGSNPYMQWPFKDWGATAVLSGHDHDYERIVQNDFPYFVTGHGGNTLYDFATPVTGSVVRYSSAHGAMLIEANSGSITFKAYSNAGGSTLIDLYTISAAVRAPAFISQSDCLFNWAERTYPNWFAPASAISNAVAADYYRYYPQSNAYLGTSSANNHVYYLGPLSNNSIFDAGSLSSWLATAGCQ
jgi:tartrate-resistant acid phosphatase type 5